MSKNVDSGVLCAIGAALLFGISTPLTKLVLSTGNSILIAGLLYLGSGLGLAALRQIRGASGAQSKEQPISRKDLPWLAGAILCGGIVAPILLLAGLLHTSASSASLLLNLEAVATTSIAWMVFRENVDRRVALGFVLILLGGILLSLPGGEQMHFSNGAALVALACLFWGIDNNLTRKVSASDPGQIAMWKGLLAGTTNLLLALTLGATLPDLSGLAAVLALGFFCYGISLVLFIHGLRHLGAARTGAYFSTAPFAGAALAFALGQGSGGWMFWSAGLLMAAGVWLHFTERHEHTHAHEPTEHEHAHVHDEHHQHVHLEADPAGEPHSHPHRHEPLVHSHPHYPDIHHQHDHPKT